MVFSSAIFLFLFLPFVLLFYYFIFKNNRKMQNVFLLLASLFFYAWGEPWFVVIIVLSILANWLFGLLVDRYRNAKIQAKIIMATMVLLNLSIMFIFKYLIFTLKNINTLFSMTIKVPTIILPIGISFFTFQAISYVVDVYRGDGQVQQNPLNVGLYIAFFPQLIAGPIVRYQTVADQIQGRKETIEDFSDGVCRFVIGLGKKVLLANTMAIVADTAFAIPTSELSLSFSWLGATAYSFQILFDFSGYSDMAIGLGKMFGFHFLENFDHPYMSLSISEFWRRWHISLGTWFKDYVYIPMGGSRVKGKTRLFFNLFVVWLLTGLWHGANWTFIIWGLMYFLLISFEKISDLDKKVKNKLVRRLYTLFFVQMGWVIFRAANIGQATSYIKTMLGMGADIPVIDYYTIRYFGEHRTFFIFAFICSMPVSRWIAKALKNCNTTIAQIGYALVYLVLFFVAISYVVKGTYNPFIYFNF